MKNNEQYDELIPWNKGFTGTILKEKDLQQIVRLQLTDLANLLNEQGLNLLVEDEVIDVLFF